MASAAITARDLITYCAMPSRLGKIPGTRDACINIIRRLGLAPVYTFDTIAFIDGEGNKNVGRQPTLDFLIDIIRACGTFGFFGPSSGTMVELDQALASNRRVCAFPCFDPDWTKEYEQWKENPKERTLAFADPLAELRRRRTVITLTGGRGTGKTWGSNHAIKVFPNLCRILSTTTRVPRDADDAESYNFVSCEQFEALDRDRAFIERDQYRGAHYGLTSIAVEAALVAGKTGVIALTERGVQGLQRVCGDCTTIISYWVKCPPALHEKDLIKRGFTNIAERNKLIDETLAEHPPEFPYRILQLEDDGDEANANRFIEALNPDKFTPRAE